MKDEDRKRLTEFLGKCWHYNNGCCYSAYTHSSKEFRCICGLVFPGVQIDIHCAKENPNYADDPRLVLEGMREGKDFVSFLRSLIKYTENDTELLNFIVNFILDRTGRLRDLAIEFMKEGK